MIFDWLRRRTTEQRRYDDAVAWAGRNGGPLNAGDLYVLWDACHNGGNVLIEAHGERRRVWTSPNHENFLDNTFLQGGSRRARIMRTPSETDAEQ